MAEDWVWIGGWGIEPGSFQQAAQRHLPAYRHAVLAPGESAVEQLVTSRPQRIGGYSLGSLLLLSEWNRLAPEHPVFLLAPFLAFCSEGGRGGTTPRATLASIRERLDRDPGRAIRLFHRLAGLDEPQLPGLPYAAEDLAWGLRALAEQEAPAPPRGACHALFGNRDPLIDRAALASAWPGCIEVDGAGHGYEPLLESLARGPFL